MYAITSLTLILSGIVFTCQMADEKQHGLTKGYLFSFNELRGCGLPPPAQHIHSRYHFTNDPLYNDRLLNTLKQDLDLLGRAYDSLHGVAIIFQDETPYEYYLKTIATCHVYPPKEIQAYRNCMYVHAVSRYQLREDSLYTASLKRFGTWVPDITYP